MKIKSINGSVFEVSESEIEKAYESMKGEAHHTSAVSSNAVSQSIKRKNDVYLHRAKEALKELTEDEENESLPFETEDEMKKALYLMLPNLTLEQADFLHEYIELVIAKHTAEAMT